MSDEDSDDDLLSNKIVEVKTFFSFIEMFVKKINNNSTKIFATTERNS